MHELESRLAKGVIRGRWWIIVVSILLVALAASGAKNLTMTNSYRVYFGPDDPQRVAFETLENIYVKDDGVIIVIAPKDGKVFTPDALAVVEALTEQAWQLPYSSRVDSVTNFQHTDAENDDLIVADLVRNAATLNAEDLARIKAAALAEPMLLNRLISADARVTALNVNMQLPGIDEAVEIPSAIIAARELIAQATTDYPNFDFYLTGMTAMHQAFAEAAMSDMSVLVPVSFGVMFIVLAFLAGGFVGTFATIFVIAFSIAATMGLTGHIGWAITPTSAPAPNIILTVAVANSVHILVSYFHSLREGKGKHEALQESLRVNIHPVSLASMTTAVGFLTMNFSEVPPFQQMGTIIATGVIISLVLSLTFLPALLAVLPTGRVRYSGAYDNGVSWLADVVVKYRRRLLWIMSAVAVVLVAYAPRNTFNDLYLHYFDETMEFRNATDFTIENLTGFYNVHYSLDSGSSGGVSEPEFLRHTAEFAEWWRKQPETVHVSTFTDTMMRLNKNMHGDDPAMYKLPENRDLAAQYLLLYEMSLPYGLDLNNQINVDKSATRVVVTLKTISTAEILALTRRAGAWLDEQAPEIGHDEGTGMLMMFTHLIGRNIKSMMIGTAVALVLISALLIVALRSFKIGILSVIPNIAPIGMGFGIWAFLNGEIGMSLSIVATMTLGIVVDDTVHFLSKYLRARREKGLSSEDAVRYAFNTVGRALIVTSIVLVCGFLVLSRSHFYLNSSMGLLVAIVIALALVTVLLFLPPLLMKIELYRGGDKWHGGLEVAPRALP
jgi:uncharacterized protein